MNNTMEGEEKSDDYISKPERKRLREQQRRVEEKQAFDELASVLEQVNGGSGDDIDFKHMSRLELVHSSTVLLQKLQTEIQGLRKAARANGNDVSS